MSYDEQSHRVRRLLNELELMARFDSQCRTGAPEELAGYRARQLRRAEIATELTLLGQDIAECAGPKVKGHQSVRRAGGSHTR